MKRPSRFRFTLTADRADGRVRTFNKLVSCAHEWVRGVVGMTVTPDGGCIAQIGETCFRCRATCRRDPRGRIVEYSTAESAQIEAEAAASAEQAA